MANKPIKPGFIQEHEKTKEQEHKEVKQTEKKEAVIEEQGEKKNHKLLAVCLIIVLLMCIFGYILINVILPKTKYGRNTTTVSQNTVRDISAESKSTKTSDNLYQREADALWRVYKDELSCDASTFKSEYVQLRESGALKSDSFYELENKYGALLRGTIEDEEPVDEQESVAVKRVPAFEASAISDDITSNDEDLAKLDDDYTETEAEETEGNSEGFYYKQIEGFGIE